MIQLFIKDFNVDCKIFEPSSVLLVIESKEILVRNLIVCQNEDIEEFLSVYDAKKDMYLSNEDIDFIPNVLFIDFNTKKNLNALNKQIKSIYKEKLSDFLDDEKQKMQDLFDTIRLDYSLDIYSDISFKEDDLLKIINIKFNECDDSLVNTIISYIKVSIELRNCSIFIFHHLSLYLSSDDIKIIINESKLLGANIINVESYDISVDFDQKYILDSDLCTI